MLPEAHVAAEEDMQLYEVAMLYPADLAQKEEQDLLRTIEGLFGEEGGGIQLAKDLWGRRGLAYPIGGHREGKYAVFHYRMHPGKVKGIDQQLRITKGILRHLTLKVPETAGGVKYSLRYAEWLKEQEVAAEREKREREEELQQQIAARARRQAPPRERRAEKKGEVTEEKITEQIEKIITDQDIAL